MSGYGFPGPAYLNEGVEGVGPGYLGSDDASSPGEKAAKLYEQIAPAAGLALDAMDPRVQVETLKARIANYKKMKKKIPALALFYDNEIARMKAKLRAVESKLALKEESERSTRDWRTLGKTAAGVGVVAGVALVGLLLVVTVNAARKGGKAEK